MMQLKTWKMAHKQLKSKETILDLRRYIVRKKWSKRYRTMMLDILRDKIYDCRPNEHASYHRFGSKKEYDSFLYFKKHEKEITEIIESKLNQ
jgi:hypothetical protein